jgi:CDP-diacylglycerol--glycerol-3-phosphate 3-phosphatidyltransferase
MLLGIANTLTVGRLLAVPLLIVLLFGAVDDPNLMTAALVLVIVLQASDILDGFLARRAMRATGISNLFGQVMDPIADKLYINSTYITLSAIHGFPWAVTLVVFGRDFCLIIGWFVRKWLTGESAVVPNAWGKAADSVQAFLIFGILLQLPAHALQIGQAIVIGVTAISGLTYFAREFTTRRQIA